MTIRRVVRLACLAGLAAGIVLVAVECKKKNGRDSEPASVSTIENLKVTATGDDPCRIVLKHAVFTDTVTWDKKNVVATLLSDGSGNTVLGDIKRLLGRDTDVMVPDNYLLSADQHYLIYDAGIFQNTRICHNLYFYDLKTGEKDSLFTDALKYDNGYGLYIYGFSCNPGGTMLAVSVNDLIRCRDLVTNRTFDIPCKVPFEQVWINSGELLCNKRHNGKKQCIRVDASSRKTAVVASDDTLPLKSASATENGNRILTYTSAEDTSGGVGDSLYFRDNRFNVVSAAFITHEQRVVYKIGLQGKWLYYTDDRALRRVRIEMVENKNVSLDQINETAQVICPFPIRVEEGEIRDVGYGSLQQLLPIENGKK